MYVILYHTVFSTVVTSENMVFWSHSTTVTEIMIFTKKNLELATRYCTVHYIIIKIDLWNCFGKKRSISLLFQFRFTAFSVVLQISGSLWLLSKYAYLVCRFSYVTSLRVVCCKLEVEHIAEVDSLLDGLYPGDSGLTSPNPTTHYLLAKNG